MCAPLRSNLFNYRPQRSWGKVMFLHVSVILYPSMPCSRSPRGWVLSQHALQVSRPTPGGKLRGLAGGGLQAQHALRQTPPPPTATAAGGTHPTGMNAFLFSCSFQQIFCQTISWCPLWGILDPPLASPICECRGILEICQTDENPESF